MKQKKSLMIVLISTIITLLTSIAFPKKIMAANTAPFNCNTNSGGVGIDTAIGCIPLDKTDFITFILQWAIGVGGGVAFLLIILASFQIMTSQGDPKRLEAGKELLSSAIMGLILLIFSVTILRIVGVDIFHIAGF